MTKKIYLILFSLITCINLSAQVPCLNSKLIDENTYKPVENAIIKIHKKSAILYQTQSDSLGNFSLPLFILKGSYLRIQASNYKEVIINCVSDKCLSDIVKMQSIYIQLDEVIVKANKRYRDTSKIDLSNQLFERSIMISDLFSGDIGFHKDRDGKLYYKGKPVSNLTVNGDNFFGNNNFDIYKLLPALTLENIEIVETNIDSLTNITMLKPVIKVNLKLKEKFDKGKFGNANIGLGTLQRNVATTDLYSYKNKQQISFALNSNNVNISDNLLQEPSVSFSTNSNNIAMNSSRATYRNIIGKLEVNFRAKGKLSEKHFGSESERLDININQSSKTSNLSNSRFFNLSETSLDLNYKIDPFNVIYLNQAFDYNKVEQSDSTYYNINSNKIYTIFQLMKNSNKVNNFSSSKITYQKRSSSKTGRILSISSTLNIGNYSMKEENDVIEASKELLKSYYINGERKAKENILLLNVDFTEPLNEASFLSFFTEFKRGKITYNTNINSDTIRDQTNKSTNFTNHYLSTGVKFQQNLNKLSFNGTLALFANQQHIYDLYHTKSSFNRLNLDLNFEYRINTRRNLSWSYKTDANFPDVSQLTSINNPFDLVSQMNNNIYLKPEQKRSMKLAYEFRKSDSESLNIHTNWDNYSSKFGLNISSGQGNVQQTYIDNIGGTNSAQFVVSIYKALKNGSNINCSTNLDYQEVPIKLNGKLDLNYGITLNQSLSTSYSLIKSTLSSSPLLSVSTSKYYYAESSINATSISYADKITLDIAKGQITLAPLFTYSYNITNAFSWSVNGAVKKSFLKNQGLIWLQMYDIFNSYRFYNNSINSTYTQTIKYSNLNRYLLLGITLKFNNMK